MTTMSAKRLRALKHTDDMPGPLRECVHEFGYPIVYALMKYGITELAQIRDIVREIWSGGRQGSSKGNSGGARSSIDYALSHEILSYNGLVRLLHDSGFAIVPISPTRAMLDASLSEVSGHNVVCSKEEKHRRRLRAAVYAGFTSEIGRKLR